MRGFWVAEDEEVRFITPYDRAFVEALKEAVPYEHRWFDGESKTWLVSKKWSPVALVVARDHFDTMIELHVSAPATSAPPPSSSSARSHSVEECLRRVRALFREEATLYLLPHAPEPVVRAAFRALARTTHPDVAGAQATAAMVELNRAYDAVLRRVGAAS